MPPVALTPLVMLHGFSHTSASWAPVASRLQADRVVLAPDLRGHGAASEARPVSLDAVIDDLDAAAPRQFVLAGYSMGGRIALHVALALRERVSRLVLVGASPGLADPAEREARRLADETLAEQIERLAIEQVVEAWEQRTRALMGEGVSRAVRQDRLRNTPSGLAEALRGLGTGALPPLWDRLDELPMPVTLLVGERDLKFAALAEQMAALIADAGVVVVLGAGHAVHIEAPDAVAQSL